MAEVQTSGGSLLVAISETFALVKVSGRATFKLAPSLKRFCTTALGSGCKEVIFDMEECSGMDSTFMGILAGVAIRPADANCARHVILITLTPKTHGMLTTLGLGPVLECHEQDEATPELKQRLAAALHLDGLDIGDGDDRNLSLATMLQAHQHLVDIAPENMAKFKDVLTYLNQEIKSGL